jgi:hypothetical protein
MYNITNSKNKKMNILKNLALIISVLCIVSCSSNSKKHQLESVNIIFQEDSLRFTEPQKDFILQTINQSEIEVRKLFPNLPDSIKVVVEKVDWDLDIVGGTTGRTETNTPPLVMVQISNNYKEGIIDSTYASLKATIFHEFHHLTRGWAIQDNKFSYGIPNSMVNEGLAVVFTEFYTGTKSEIYSYPDDVDDWVKEILELPLDASYSDWAMGEHPDGRTAIAYRAGNYLIRKAMMKSGKNIFELSELMPDEIINLAGY